MSFPKYEAYKDSGVDQLGPIPSQWIVSRLGFESWIRARLGWKGLKAEEYVDEGYIFLSTPNIKGRDIDFENVNYINQIRFDESPEIKLREGDVLLAKDGSTLGIANFVRTLPHLATVNSSIAVITPHERLNGLYLKYLFESTFLQNTIQSFKGGMGVPHLFQSDLNKFYITLPEIDEQTQIARFLDHETARIEALIAEQQRLIELLKEKRQAVIAHAVTKGLDPTAPMKDSGVEWLGEVPAHWEVGALRWYATIQGGIAKGKDYEGRETVTLPYLRVANVQSGFVDLTEVKEISVLESEIERYSLRVGDVLMNEGGDNDKLGRGTVWRGEISPCLHQNHVFAIRTDKELHHNWLAKFTQSEQARFYFYLNSKQSTNLASISASNVMSLSLPLPSVSEQQQILKYLEEDRKQHEELVDVATSTVELLQERRSALISAAVTGKIDVRGWQAPANASPAPTLEPVHG